MKSLLSTLDNFPGIAGFWCHKPGSDPSYSTSDSIPKQTLKELALQLSMFFTFAETQDFPMKVVRFTFNTYNTIGIRLPDTSLLLVLCESQANPSLIINVIEKMLPTAK